MVTTIATPRLALIQSGETEIRVELIDSTGDPGSMTLSIERDALPECFFKPGELHAIAEALLLLSGAWPRPHNKVVVV